jgi:MoaA/NifB/PqqE/SkfB family radical SAM enzyme
MREQLELDEAMTLALQQAYADSCIPFIDGAISAETVKLKPWRVFLEVNSACNLFCPTCTKGNQRPIEGLRYEHKSGFMDPMLMDAILEKIASENPNAIVFLYGNSEPFLHPNLPECIRAIHRYGLHPEMSTNLNVINRVDEVLAARPDLIIVSLSGFTQDIYVRGHAGGNIERVKENMRLLAECNNVIPEERRVKILVNYHVYNDNEHEIAPMKEYAQNLGLGFFTSMARAISMENAVQYCRSYDLESTPFEVQEGQPDWNKVLPPVGQTYRETMRRLRIPPTHAQEMYKDIPESEICPVGAGGMFTFIRHDGQTSLCACTADRRLKLTDYLDTTPEQFIEQRVNHSFCKECKSRKLNMYFHLVDREKWEP